MTPDDDALEKTAFLGAKRGGPAAPAPPRIIVIDGASRGRVLDLAKAESFVGRKDDCDLALTSSSVSKRHARVTIADGVVFVEDLHSTNGVRINGRAIEVGVRRALCHGDLLDVSDHRLLFLDERCAAGGDAFRTPLDQRKIAAEADALFADFTPVPEGR